MATATPDLLSIRPASENDAALILSFIQKLAEYEKLSHEVVATEAALHNYLFGAHRVAEVILAYWGAEPAGFALFFQNFSTFLARPGLYLEDLFVEPHLRGKGIGKALLARLAQVAAERGCGRLEWSVLNWNQPSIRFYRKLGAQAKDEWTVYRLTGSALQQLAAGDGR